MMRRKYLIMTGLLLVLCSFGLTACNDDQPIDDTDITEYTVTFDSLGGSPIESQKVISGNPAVKPTNPTKDGNVFQGWYKSTENTLENSWRFELDRVTNNITLYAGWLLEENEESTASLTFEVNEDGYTVTGVGDEARVFIPAMYNNLPVTKIGEAAFARKNLTSVVIPSSVTEIALNAFHNCGELVTVHFAPDSALASIGRNAFSGNSALEEVHLPRTLTTIGDGAFNNCGSLKVIEVAASNPVYHSTGSNLIEIATNTLIRGTNTSIIPEGVTKIAEAAFRRSTSLQTINIPASVTNIGNYAFDDIPTLSSITVDNGSSTFVGEDGILYNKEKTVMVFAPEGLAGRVTVASNLLAIPMFAFDGRDHLTELVIPAGSALAQIGNFAIRNKAMTKITYGGTVAEWETITKSSVWLSGASLTTIVCSDGYAMGKETQTTALIVYFSRTGYNYPNTYITIGYTAVMAGYIQSLTSADMFEIVPVVPYPDSYNETTAIVREEQSTNARPAIKNTLADLANYDTIYIGFPIWYGDMPYIMRTFLETYDLSNKTIIPFSTHASSGLGNSVQTIKSYLPNNTILEGHAIAGSAINNESSKTSVETWLKKIGTIA